MDKRYTDIKKQIDEYFNNKAARGWHNGFHIDMPFGLINDPNGLCEHDGEIFIFYQWNPFGCEHKHKHWGLVKTADFINYTRPELVLCPEQSFDKDGCYSGCAVSQSEGLQLYYTGNVKNAAGERETYQVAAHYDGKTAVKDEVVIAGPPQGYTAHFRDPFYFEFAGYKCMLLGAQREDLTGSVVLYRRVADKWQLWGEVKTGLSEFGYMWECPNVLELSDGRLAILFCPQGLAAKDFGWQNKYQSGYIIGRLDEATLSFKHDDFVELDYGFDFYAPQIFKCRGESVLIGWSGMPDCDDEYPTDREGWKFALTFPRVLREKSGHLYQLPHKSLQQLRRNPLALTAAAIDVPERRAEIQLEFSLGEISPEINFIMGDERIVLAYDMAAGVFTFDRRGMKLGGRGIRRCKLRDASRLKLQILVDTSMLEIYINDGSEVLTGAYFPVSQSMYLEITGDAAGTLWPLGSYQYK